MKDFIFKMPAKVRFGVDIHKTIGTILKDELGFKKIFIATDKGIVGTGIIAKIEEALKSADVEYVLFDEMIPDPTIEIVDRSAEVLRYSGADAVLAVGGGSPIDTSKAMCMLQTHEGSVREYLFGGTKTVTNEIMPLICIPTTAGTGSEMTAAAVITNLQDGTKVSVTHENLIPKLAIIDPALQLGMPPFITATTGMDAMTHAIESYTSQNAEPISDAMAIKAIEMIAANIRKAYTDGNDLDARSNMAIASTIAGVAFMNGGLGVVHGISQTIGAVAHVAHGLGNSLLLPYCMETNIKGNPAKFKDIARALGEDVSGLSDEEGAQKAVDAIFKLTEDLNIPMHLKDVGITREMFPEIIEGTMAYRMLAINPVKLNEDDIQAILERAW